MTFATTERDATHRRTFSMWEECGMQFRSNSVEAGGSIPLHSHSYDHVAAVWGPFALTTMNGDGLASIKRVDRGLVAIPAGVAHLFEYLGDGIGEVTCFWPMGQDEG